MEPKHPWKARLYTCLIMLLLALFGLIFTDIRATGGWSYWKWVSIIYGALALWLSWYLRKAKNPLSPVTIWHELVHWIALVAAAFLVSQIVSLGLVSRFMAGIFVLVLIAQAVFIAGIYIETSFLFIGLVLGTFAYTAAFTIEYLYAIAVPVILIGAVAIVLWIWYKSRKRSRMIDITLEKFREAATIIRRDRLNSPLVYLDTNIKAAQGNDIYLKAECLQPSGSFKIRGATYTFSRLSEEQKKIGVIAYSTGNHSQAVALAAKRLGIKAIVVMSPEALAFKVEATKNYGAEVIMTTPQKRKILAEEMAKEHGYYLVSPFDHIDIITGQGTIGIEIAEEMEPAAIFVPIGGGGLISGIGAAIKKIYPTVKVIGVEAKLEDDAYRSFKTGKLIGMPGPSSSIADAIKIPMLGELTYPLVKKYVDDIVTVGEQEIINATLMTLERGHLVVEPSGALALAAALTYKDMIFPIKKPIVCIASGGNVLLPTICMLLSNA